MLLTITVVWFGLCGGRFPRAQTLQSWLSLEKVSPCVYEYLMGVTKKTRARVFSVLSSERTKENGHEIRYSPFKYKTEFLYCEGGCSME